ncbi:MAG: yeaZ [Deltaproteobacteria bacterium]|nr:yeaZ [Deltaproteobacteria bacterium]
MLILALETATLIGSVALVDASMPEDASNLAMKVVGEITLNLQSTHSERLMPSIHNLLEEASLKIHDLQGISLSLGPGSFTGLRIGVSTVKGLAYALKIPVVGVSTLEALACNVPYRSSVICPLLDARKKEVYAALFQGDEGGTILRKSEDWVVSPEDLCRRVNGQTLFLGNAAEVYGEVLRKNLGSEASFAPPELSLPRAVNVAKLSLPKFKMAQTLDLFSFTPIYIRRSEAEIHHEVQGKKSKSSPG